MNSIEVEEASKRFAEKLKNGFFEVPREPNGGRLVEENEEYYKEDMKRFEEFINSGVAKALFESVDKSAKTLTLSRKR